MLAALGAVLLLVQVFRVQPVLVLVAAGVLAMIFGGLMVSDDAARDRDAA